MFSPRTTWNLTPNRLAERLHARRCAGLPVLDLTESNPTRCGFDYSPDDILSTMTQRQNLIYEPHHKGLLHARALFRRNTLHAARSRRGWYGILRVPQTWSDEEWAVRLLDDDGVLVHPGYLFDFDSEGYLVISLLPLSKVFQQGIEKTLQRVAAL
ncbi:MAG: hypothetical protein HY709_03060 [Candidatus Latescibacteria bacterium]|nr:hypothetical protein [Candidatus Latescibacterota bacterium]